MLTFTEREKYLYHLSTLMAMESTQEAFGLPSLNIREMLRLIEKNRCRKLKRTEIEQIYRDAEEEALLSRSVYEMDKQNKLDKLRKKGVSRSFRFDF